MFKKILLPTMLALAMFSSTAQAVSQPVLTFFGPWPCWTQEYMIKEVGKNTGVKTKVRFLGKAKAIFNERDTVSLSGSVLLLDNSKTWRVTYAPIGRELGPDFQGQALLCVVVFGDSGVGLNNDNKFEEYERQDVEN